MIHLNYKLSKKDSTKISQKLKEQNLTIEKYIQKLIDSDINSTIDLGKGYQYDSYLDKFFTPEFKEIKFTKLQKNLLITLIKNSPNILTVDEIIEKVWKKNNASIYTLRNIINQIRVKTFYELIISHSSKGYSLNLTKENI